MNTKKKTRLDIIQFISIIRISNRQLNIIIVYVFVQYICFIN